MSVPERVRQGEWPYLQTEGQPCSRQRSGRGPSIESLPRPQLQGLCQRHPGEERYISAPPPQAEPIDVYGLWHNNTRALPIRGHISEVVRILDILNERTRMQNRPTNHGCCLIFNVRRWFYEVQMRLVRTFGSSRSLIQPTCPRVKHHLAGIGIQD